MLAIWWSKSVITSRMGHRLTLFPLWPLDPQAAAGGRWASSPISALRRGERQLLGKGGVWLDRRLLAHLSWTLLEPVPDALGHPPARLTSRSPQWPGGPAGGLGSWRQGGGVPARSAPGGAWGSQTQPSCLRSTAWPRATFFKPAVAILAVLLCSPGFPAPGAALGAGGHQGMGGSGSVQGDEQCFGCGGAEP